MKTSPYILIILAICSLLAACAPQATAAPTVIPTPTQIPQPTATFTPEPTPTEVIPDVEEVVKSIGYENRLRNATEPWDYMIEKSEDGKFYLYQVDNDSPDNFYANPADKKLAVAWYDEKSGKWVERTPEEKYRESYDQMAPNYPGFPFEIVKRNDPGWSEMDKVVFMYSGEFGRYVTMDQNGQLNILTTAYVEIDDGAKELKETQLALSLGPEGSTEANNLEVVVFFEKNSSGSFYGPLGNWTEYGYMFRGQPGSADVYPHMIPRADRSRIRNLSYFNLGPKQQIDFSKTLGAIADLQMGLYELPEGLSVVVDFDSSQLLSGNILVGYNTAAPCGRNSDDCHTRFANGFWLK